MAQSARRSRRAPPPQSLKDMIKAGPGIASTMEAFFLASVGLTLGLGLGLSAGTRDWAWDALGYGWIPLALWVTAALTALRYYHNFFRNQWRWWLVAAAIGTISIGVLSLFNTNNGLLGDASLSGEWGRFVGGEPLTLAIGKLAAISLLTPLVLFTRPVGSIYLRGLRYLGLALQFAPLYVYMAMYHAYYFMEKRLRTLIKPNLRQQMLAKVRSTFASATPAKLRNRLPGSDDVAPMVSSGVEGEEELSFWPDSEPGIIPNWATVVDSLTDDAPIGASPVSVKKSRSSTWQLPSINLLSPAEPRNDSDAPLEQMARHVERTLSDHGVSVEVKDIKAGPRIVRFGLVPGWVAKRNDALKSGDDESKGERSRVKVQSILMREKDLALALQTPYLRIEAPVPGEALVGLEVPNPTPNKVHLRGVMETTAFGLLAAKGGLPIALGQDTGGAPVVMDLTTMPHMLIAGATGSGKSVCMNSLVATLLLTKSPEQLRMLMVDPKRVELSPFNGIPHLLMPVIVDVDQVNVALKGLMREMLHRYKQMEEVGARNIISYNSKVAEPLPYLVLLVDELADLMMAGGFEVEQNLVRLAQLGRATGIHLVLATQRPSVNVVTGLLKANIPARAAFAVASQVDSRVILDSIGAEKLLGKGDMLLLHNETPKPRRVQGTLVYDSEIDELVEHWINQTGPPLPVIPFGDMGDDDEDEVEDGLMDQARDMALGNPRISSSYLARSLKIGGRRAKQILESLDEEGILDSR